jgi:hypothetical protein
VKIETEYGTEIISEETMLDVIDKLEAELYATRQRHDCLPTPDHVQARHLLEKVGRRNRARAHR